MRAIARVDLRDGGCDDHGSRANRVPAHFNDGPRLNVGGRRTPAPWHGWSPGLHWHRRRTRRTSRLEPRRIDSSRLARKTRAVAPRIDVPEPAIGSRPLGRRTTGRRSSIESAFTRFEIRRGGPLERIVRLALHGVSAPSSAGRLSLDRSPRASIRSQLLVHVEIIFHVESIRPTQSFFRPARFLNENRKTKNPASAKDPFVSERPRVSESLASRKRKIRHRVNGSAARHRSTDSTTLNRATTSDIADSSKRKNKRGLPWPSASFSPRFSEPATTA